MDAWKLAGSSGGVSSENDKELKRIDSMMKYMKIRYDDEIWWERREEKEENYDPNIKKKNAPILSN